MSEEKREKLVSPIEAIARRSRLPRLPYLDPDLFLRAAGYQTQAEWDAPGWWDSPDAIEHAEAVAMLVLPNKTAKEKSKIMASIRESAGETLRCHKKGNRWIYHRTDWNNVAAGIRALAKRNDDDADGIDPSPQEIEWAKRTMRPKK